MPNEGFLQRWSRLKATPELAPPPPESDPSGQTPELQSPEPPPPTLADAADLTADSDYSAFVARGVDSAVRRLAMKKLFADPHFKLIDGLDIYMADYNLPSPVSAEMLASLTDAQSMFARVEDAIDALVAPDTPAPLPNNQEAE
ncbi:MAG: hypothetical protein JWP34_3147 [Massilia sp.]|nr:hypothetical protein [Massilia sp.]